MKWLLPSALMSVCYLSPALGQTVDYPEPVTRENVGDWVVECFSEPAQPGQCQMYQRILADNNTSIALVATFAVDSNGAVNSQIAVPLGIDLAAGARFLIGPEFSINAPISRCTQQGCLIEGKISNALFEQLQTQSTATLTVVDPSSGEVQIPLSLSGFNEAINRLYSIAFVKED